MEFDKSRVYTALNAAQLKIGSKVIVVDDLAALIYKVTSGRCVETLKDISEPTMAFRFITAATRYNLAYLVASPEEKKLDWTTLKIGDIIRNRYNKSEAMVIQIDKRPDEAPVLAGDCWYNPEELANEWEKVE